MGAAEFVITLRREARDEQVALLIEDEIAVGVFHEEGVAPADFLAAGRGECFPDALAGVGFEAAELAVTAHTVNVAAFEKRRGHDAVQRVGVALAAFLRAPDHGGGGFLPVEFQHHRAVVERGDEQLITDMARRGHAQAGTRDKFFAPINFARFRIERVDRFRMPDDELPFSAGLDDRRRTIARLLRRECAPEFLAGVLVERHRHGAVAADEADELVAVDEWMAGETPHRRRDLVVHLEIALPKNFPLGHIEAVQIPLRAERVNFVAAHGRRGAGAGRITHGVGTFVGVLPDDFSVRLVEAEHAFVAGNEAAREGIGRIARAGVELAVEDEHAAIGNGGPGVTGADGNAPADGRAVRGKCFHNPRLAPDAVALRAEPLRPVRGAHGGKKKQ